MSQETDVARALNKAMDRSLLALEELVASDISQSYHLLEMVQTFLTGVISTAIDLVELKEPGSQHELYAELRLWRG